MKIRPDEKQPNVPGDFGDVGGDAILHVSPKVFRAARAIGTPTAEALYDAAQESPATIANLLNWSPEEVQTALADLAMEISKARPGYFQRELKSPRSFGMGALPPRRKGST